MGDPSPDLKALSERLVNEGMAVEIESGGISITPPRTRRGSIEAKIRYNRFKAEYNARFNLARAELHEQYRLAEIEIAKENIRF